MRAELVLIGKRIDMAPQANRRTLVVLIYATLALVMAGLYWLDGWRVAGTYVVAATFLINRFLLGGYHFGGLIKPFSGKPPASSDGPPPFVLLALRVHQPEPGRSEYRSDERELAQRDRAHFKAYGGLTVALCWLWILAGLNAFYPQLLPRIQVSPGLLLYGCVLASIVVALTLPQAILLWTEPDMENEPDLAQEA